ncbi:hypothetical protein [Mycolicibacterium fluoranthenivorans]|jgi:hypothetical protein|uniref:Uncharacterized protein n=1 Tax=Mycolicibacterium fluoranthenivorans TaxID=258505 RepID=A0A1G4WRJ9_9MYCO|nr:hypothetical protein [Mycolicibacterium fluoranthenivorans]SCX28101.1 hypothetical protein SAMN02799620_04524 [Mycolicibacterium fluoranthenivorans]
MIDLLVGGTVVIGGPALLCWLFFRSSGGKTTQQQAYDRLVQRRKEEIGLGYVDGKVNSEAAQQFRDEL